MTNLELEQVAHLEPANFWIGPAVVRVFYKLIKMFAIVSKKRLWMKVSMSSNK